MVLMRTRVGRRHLRDEQGAIAILTALLMVVLTVCAAIVVDLGLARDVRRQSQNAADAASLAGANALYPSTKVCQTPLNGAPPCKADADAAVRTFADKNFQVITSDWSTCTAALPSGYVKTAEVPVTSCISYDSATAPTKVRVVMPTRTLRTFFGGVTGRQSIPVGSSAEAQVGIVVKCSLCFLGGVNAENADFKVYGEHGSIAVNGSVNAHKGSEWQSKSTGVVGDVGDATYTPGHAFKIPTFGDPLSSLTMPDTTALPKTVKTDPCGTGPTHGPGFYADLPKKLTSPCTLEKGLYVISGTWGLKNNEVLTGNGVTLYVQKPGYLDFKLGDVKITAPAPSEANAGYAIIYDRDNAQPLSIQGNDISYVTGVVYAPASLIDFNGRSCFKFSKGPIVVLGVDKANGQKACVEIYDAAETEVTRTLLHLDQ